MNIGIPKETVDGETRVSIIPDTVKRFRKKDLDVVVEKGAGAAAHYPDSDYEKAGAGVSDSAYEAELFVRINPPNDAEIGRLPEGSTLVSFLYPLANGDLVRQLAARKVSAIAVDMIPRTSLAQSMDALSSQANLAGYKAVIHAADLLPKFFPMLMTAAGTVRPAKVLVLGAGVAGLQAIATARRLGAVVEAFDVRKVVKDQVESLGARFVMVDEGEDAAGEGGYAKESSQEYQQKQKELLRKHVAKSDVCITTALIPGRKAPILITEEMVKAMPEGGVIVDLAAANGGNCEGTEPGKEIVKHGVTLVGNTNLPGTVAVHASQLYSKNMEKLLFHMMGDGALRWDMEDEITKGCVIIRDGEVIHPKVKEAMG